MSNLGPYIIGAVLIVAVLALVMARFPLFQRDLRRSLSFGVAFVGLLIIVLSVHVLNTGLGLRSAAVAAAEAEMVSQWNGLILGALLLLMVSSLAFFFAMGVFMWSLVPTTTEPPRNRMPVRSWGGLESAPQTLNALHDR